MSCVEYSINKFLERDDPNPMIVRALNPDGSKIDHWYYRAGDFVSTSIFGILGAASKPIIVTRGFEGMISEMDEKLKLHFTEGRYELASYEQRIAIKLKEEGRSKIESMIDVYGLV